MSADGATPISFALAPSMNIDTIVARRDALVAKIKELRRVYVEMHAVRNAIFGDKIDDEMCSSYEIRAEWGATRRDLDDDGQVSEAVKRVDAKCWDRLLTLSGLRQMMDAQIRKEWDTQLEEHKMPEFSRKHIDATFASLGSQRGEIFERGVVNVFRTLSWQYKTNTPVKLGKRMICTSASERHAWRDKNNDYKTSVTVFGPAHSFAAKLDDLIRAFCVLEGKPEPTHVQGAYHTLTSGEWMKETLLAGEDPKKAIVTLHGYVTFRGYKNGNAHLTFLRPDLIDKLNRIIAKHYPNALPPGDSDE